MTVYIDKFGGTQVGSHNLHQVLREIAQYQGRNSLSSVAALTDSSGATASVSRTVSSVLGDAVNAANSGTSLAGKASTETALATVQDAMLELWTKAAALGTKVSLTAPTYSGGGTAADGTVGAITVAVTAATTGVPAAALNTFLTALHKNTYNLAIYVNQLCEAAGVSTLVISHTNDVASTIPVISTATGAAVDPGVTKVAADAKLAAIAINVATIAARLNALRAGVGNATVVAR